MGTNAFTGKYMNRLRFTNLKGFSLLLISLDKSIGRLQQLQYFKKHFYLENGSKQDSIVHKNQTVEKVHQKC